MSPATLLPLSSSLIVNHKMEFTISEFGHSKVKRQAFQTEVSPKASRNVSGHLVTPIVGISNREAQMKMSQPLFIYHGKP